MDVGARQIDLNISETANLLAFTYKIIPRVYSVLAWKRENIQYVSVLWPKMPCWCLRSRRRDNNSNNHLFQPSYAKELIWAQKTPLTLQADAIQQPKTTTICTGWPKLDNRSLEKCCLIRRLRIRSKPHDSMTPSCIIYIWRLNWWSWGKGAEDIFLAYIELLSTNWKTFNCHSLHGYCSWPSPLLYDRSLPVAKTSHKAQIILNWLLEHDSAFTVPQSSPIQPGTSGMLSGQPR